MTTKDWFDFEYLAFEIAEGASDILQASIDAIETTRFYRGKKLCRIFARKEGYSVSGVGVEDDDIFRIAIILDSGSRFSIAANAQREKFAIWLKRPTPEQLIEARLLGIF